MFADAPRLRLAAILPLVLIGVATMARAEIPIDRLEVEPSAIRISGAGGRQQVAVTAIGSDGSVRDRTTEARFRVEPSGVAAVSTDGVVTPVADGEARLVVEADGLYAEASIRVVEARRVKPASYRLEVAPLLSKAGCNSGLCHGNLNGKGGFKLSLRGDNPDVDLDMLIRDAFGRRVDRTRPEASLALLKPTGRLAHEGGRRFDWDSPEAETLRTWIAAGARDDAATAPAVTRLRIFPDERIAAAPSLAQQLVVTAELSDGSTRDVTRQATYELNDATKGTVTTGGRVEADAPGELAVAVRYLGGRAVSRLAFLADRPDFAWGDPQSRNLVDEHVFAKLKALRVHPSPPADDATILRRAYLDAIGRLPTPEEVRAFLADSGPGKRDDLVDRLIERPEFADYWALKWADLLRNEEKTMGGKGVWVFQRWLRDQIAADVPLDDFARQIVTARGSTWLNPPASFYRTNRDPETAAETVGQVFLGVRLQCARCHNHPADVWTQDDYYGLAAFFGNVQRKQLDPSLRDKFDKHEINGDVMVYLAGRAEVIQPRSGEMMTPKPLGASSESLGDDPEALDQLAGWLTGGNRQFARNLANRAWFHLLGRGIVEPVDDFRDSNPPSNPALLEALTDHFEAGGMRLKPLVALIMKSATYQADSRPLPTNVDDEANFARGAVRLLPAEILLDALGDVFEVPESFAGAPPGARAVQLPGARPGAGESEGQFLKVFGKPDRLMTCECERSDSTTLAQAFQLINGPSIRRKLEADRNRIGRLIAAGLDDPAILDELYLATLCRAPSDAERRSALGHLDGEADRRRGWEDVAWAIVNSKEFLLRH